METKFARACLQSFLKVVNSTLGIVRIAMILYGRWMIRAWQREMEEFVVRLFQDYYSMIFFRFIYTFLGAGVTWCAITCVGHLAASVANSCCLSCTAIGADILLNSDWEKDLPNDPAGRFKDFKDFVKSNFDSFKWIGLLIILAQGLSILLAMALSSIGPYKDADIDDEFAPARLPLIKHGVQPAPLVGAEQRLSSKATNAWKTKKRNKISSIP